MSDLERVERIKEAGGWLERYRHPSKVCTCTMTFSVYLPPRAEHETVPAVYWLSGLTCTDDNFRVKAGAQRYASELGLALIIPDTSPRGEGVPDDPEYDFGKGAGFYVNAVRMPWSQHYHMYDYVVSELPALMEANFPLQPGVRSVTGHSMGGHGALVVALRNPGMFRSVSAFAPICHPTECPWGQKAFSGYLGDDRKAWEAYDATHLVLAGAKPLPTFVDQGTDDEFLQEQLNPWAFQGACSERGYSLTFRMQDGYDHSYHFIATFIGEHLAFHQKHLEP